jgi:hypothetical protein
VTAFVTVTQMEAALQRPLVATAAEEALDQACDMVRDVLGAYSPDWVADDVAVLSGTDRATLLLPRLPVVAVSSVTVRDCSGTITTLTVDVDWQLDDDDAILWRLNGRWPWGIRNITATYDHGIQDPADLPPGLRAVTITLASRLYYQHPSIPGVRSESLGASSYTTDDTFAGGLSKLETQTLERIKQHRMPAA